MVAIKPTNAVMIWSGQAASSAVGVAIYSLRHSHRRGEGV